MLTKIYYFFDYRSKKSRKKFFFFEESFARKGKNRIKQLYISKFSFEIQKIILLAKGEIRKTRITHPDKRIYCTFLN
ncbi:hypothetical protein HMPREF9012_0865 [Bacteroidetes bacterium oral taxon 272 str. F0290]|nr:hypothetical protein HMPREF9012_0865 [Bacteroidetes bacterium oral taxon 272 str. F0290]